MAEAKRASRIEAWSGAAVAIITALGAFYATQSNDTSQNKKGEMIYTTLRDNSVRQETQIQALQAEIGVLREDNRSLRDWLRKLVSEDNSEDASKGVPNFPKPKPTRKSTKIASITHAESLAELIPPPPAPLPRPDVDQQEVMEPIPNLPEYDSFE